MTINDKSYSGKERSFLIIEDSLVSSQILCSLVKSIWGVTAEVADNGERAISYCKSRIYDIIFMDLGLPDYNGFEVAGIVVDYYDAHHFKLPCIIGISGSTHSMVSEYPKSVAESLRHFVGFLEKPFSVEKLKKIAPIIEGVFEKSRILSVESDAKQAFNIIELEKKLPEIDLREVLSRIDNNFYFLINLLNFYKQDCLQSKINIINLLNEKKWVDLKGVLNALKGTSRNIFCHTIADACQSVEETILFGKKEVEEELYFLVDRLGYIAIAIDFFLQSCPAYKKQLNPYCLEFETREKLFYCIETLVNKNSAQAEDYLDYFIGQFKGVVRQDVLLQLYKDVEVYDFPSARETLKVIGSFLPSYSIDSADEQEKLFLKKPTILIAEDALTSAKMVAGFLGKDYNLLIVRDGKEALRVASLPPYPDLILMDVNMPFLNGYAVCQALKRDKETNQIPLIFLTANGTKEEELYGFKLGAVDYITKPVSLLVLLARIETHLKLRRYQLILESQVKMDTLTGLGNRLGLTEFIDMQWRRSLRRSTPLALLMIDVDHFKLYNDTYGHVRGDECLVRVAQVIQSVSNQAEGYSARYGGEEFVAVFSETGRETACTLAERIRLEIEKLQIENRKNLENPSVSVSIGVSIIEPHREVEQVQLVQQADEALYKAKNAGRNRVFCGK